MMPSHAKKIEVAQNLAIEQKSNNVATAYLEEIMIDSLNIKYLKIKGEYKCNAKIKKINMVENEPIQCHETALTCNLDMLDQNSAKLPANFHFNIEKLLISKYQKEKTGNNYMLDFFQAKIRFQNANISAQSISTDTKTRNIYLYGCRGSYKIGISMLSFSTQDKISIKDLIISGENVRFVYDNYQIFDQTFNNIVFHTQKIKINYQKDIQANKIAGNLENLKISIEELKYENEKYYLKNIAITNSDKTKLIVKTSNAFIENNKIIFPNSIHIQTKELNLQAENGRQEGNMILLKKISYKKYSISGFSETGYFDIKNKKLILSNGKITW